MYRMPDDFRHGNTVFQKKRDRPPDSQQWLWFLRTHKKKESLGKNVKKREPVTLKTILLIEYLYVKKF